MGARQYRLLVLRLDWGAIGLGADEVIIGGGASPINLVLSARTKTFLDLVAKNCMKLSPSSKVMVVPLDLSTLTDRRNVTDYMLS